jgi:hypothetical protein
MASPASGKLQTVSGTTATDTVYRVPVGKLGLQEGVHRAILKFRASIEAAVAQAHGGVGIGQAKRVRTAVVCLAEAKRAQHKLQSGGLTHEQEMGWSDRLLRAEQACDRALAALGVDTRPPERPVGDDFWRRLGIPPIPAAPNAPTGPLDDLAANSATDLEDK